MKTGFRGTFVISWTQTEVDGLGAAPLDAIEAGAAWSWRGDTVQVDGPNDVLRLDMADGEANLRKRAARKVRRLIGAAVQDLATNTVHAAIALGYVKFSHVKGEDNPADILTKYLEPYKVEKITKPLLFWQGVLPDWPPITKKQKVDNDGE